jgi:hypothetical protein
MAGSPDGHGLAGAQIIFPRQACRLLAKFREGGGIELAKTDDNPAGCAEVEVGKVEGAEIAVEGNAALLFACGGKRETTIAYLAQLTEFLGSERLEARGSNGKKVHRDSCSREDKIQLSP